MRPGHERRDIDPADGDGGGTLESRTLEALARLGRASSVDGFCRDVCRELQVLVPGRWVALDEFDLSTRRLSTHTWPVFDEDWHLRYDELHAEYAHLHPLLGTLVQRVDPTPCTWTERPPTPAFRASPLGAEVYRRMGITDQAAIRLDATFPTVWVLTVNRAEPGFSSEELRALALWRPQVANLLSLMRAREPQRVQDEPSSPVPATLVPGGHGSGLPVEDQERLLAAISRVGRAETLDEFARAACRELYELVPGLWASYNEANVPSGRVAATVWPEREPDWYESHVTLLAEFADQNPLVRYIAEAEEPEVRTLDDLDPDGGYFQTELFQRYYLPQGARSQAAFALPAPPGIVIAMVINRDGSPFTERERRIMNELRLHLSNIYRFVAGHENRRVLSRAVERDGWHTVLVSDEGVVVESHEAAVRIGDAIGTGLRVGDRIAGTSLWARVSQRADSETSVRPVAREAAVSFSVGDAAYEASLTVHPVGPHMLLLRPVQTATVESAMSLGLTPRQAEVALLLVDGATNVQVARALRISEGTARKHVEAILATLGVPSRAGAAVAVLRARVVDAPEPG